MHFNDKIDMRTFYIQDIKKKILEYFNKDKDKFVQRIKDFLKSDEVQK